ncbi:hypothetical protein RN001_003858 [Aquatica leii]|uniref:Mevalonate kinase n=1 Tax=Aquatica leii TaxID=1421715 RepID=A0AAN7Q9Y0_9COLE|nr:hypothetical protein RN001_003858 [Aquatica leii]
MTYTEVYIRDKLIKELDAIHVEVIDESDGCGGKFSCIIVSEKSEGKPLLSRHRLVNNVLQEELKIMSLNNHLASVLKFTVSAPGKVILYGDHSVVYDKSAIASSLGLRTRLYFTETPESKYVTIEVPSVALTYTCELEVLQQRVKNLPSIKWQNPDVVNHEEFLNIVDSFIKQSSNHDLSAQQCVSLTCIFYLYFGIVQSINVKSFSIKIETDLTLGAGTGSSASFAVVIAGAFIHYLRLKSNNNKTTFTEEELGIISKWAYSVEKICHGKPSGIDNTVCTYGSMVEFRKSHGMQFFSTTELELLLVNTKQPRSTKQLVGGVAALKENHNSVVELILNAMNEIAKSALDCILEISKANQESSKKHYERLGELTNINQCMLQALGVSHPKLDDICSILKRVGLCGKLTGAGGGGYAISIVPPHIKREIIQDVIEELTSKGYEAILTKLGGSGVTVH